MNTVVYPYADGDPIDRQHSYAYVPFQGDAFLSEWRLVRRRVLVSLGGVASSAPSCQVGRFPEGCRVNVAELLEILLSCVNSQETGPEVRRWLDWVLQRFEASKRIFTEYRLEGERPKGFGTKRNFALYLRFAELMAAHYSIERRLPALNALLKCLDILSAFSDRLESSEKFRLARLIKEEAVFVDRLSCRKAANISTTVGEAEFFGAASRASFTSATSLNGKKILGRVVFLAADTMRSRSYAQALVAEGFYFDVVILVKSHEQARWGQSTNPPAPPNNDLSFGSSFPDLRRSLEDSCSALTDRVETVISGTVNCEAVCKLLQGLDPEFVIYSGFGGELVKPAVLTASGPMLHMHAGWLPDYRGSTTVYYSLLDHGVAGVTAILLSPEIDVGEMLCRCNYPPPPKGVELDYYYDGLIRSDMMVRVLKYVWINGGLPPSRKQDQARGEVYYIIHPVLKHLSVGYRVINNLLDK
ncbi:MAG: formyltransferase family protein [Pseudomonadota bacterium]